MYTTILYFFWNGFTSEGVIAGTPEPIRTTRRDPSQVTRTRSEHATTPNLPTRKPTVER